MIVRALDGVAEVVVAASVVAGSNVVVGRVVVGCGAVVGNVVVGALAGESAVPGAEDTVVLAAVVDDALQLASTRLAAATKENIREKPIDRGYGTGVSSGSTTKPPTVLGPPGYSGDALVPWGSAAQGGFAWARHCRCYRVALARPTWS